MSWYKKKIIDRRNIAFKRFKARHSFDGLGIVAEFADLSFETWNGIVPRSDLHLIQQDLGIDIERLNIIIEDAKAAELMFEDERGIYVDSVPESKEQLDKSRESAKERMRLKRADEKFEKALSNNSNNLENCSHEHAQERASSTFLSNTSNTSNISNNKIDTKKIPPEPLDEFMQIAEDALEQAESEVCQKSTIFMNTGRRPMRRYPEIWITRSELADVFKQYLDTGIPKDKFHIGFKPVAGKLRTIKGEGKTTNNVSAYNWLIGWALQETLVHLKKENDLKRSEQYLENSRAK